MSKIAIEMQKLNLKMPQSSICFVAFLFFTSYLTNYNYLIANLLIKTIPAIKIPSELIPKITYEIVLSVEPVGGTTAISSE